MIVNFCIIYINVLHDVVPNYIQKYIKNVYLIIEKLIYLAFQSYKKKKIKIFFLNFKFVL